MRDRFQRGAQNGAAFVIDRLVEFVDLVARDRESAEPDTGVADDIGVEVVVRPATVPLINRDGLIERLADDGVPDPARAHRAKVNCNSQSYPSANACAISAVSAKIGGIPVAKVGRRPKFAHRAPLIRFAQRDPVHQRKCGYRDPALFGSEPEDGGRPACIRSAGTVSRRSDSFSRSR